MWLFNGWFKGAMIEDENQYLQFMFYFLIIYKVDNATNRQIIFCWAASLIDVDIREIDAMHFKINIYSKWQWEYEYIE